MEIITGVERRRRWRDEERLERWRFVWPTAVDGEVEISPAQLGYMLEGIDWRHPRQTWWPGTARQFLPAPAFFGIQNRVICDSHAAMDALPKTLPDDPTALRAALIAERAARVEAEQKLSSAAATIAHLELMVARLRQDKFGASSEGSRKLLEQMDLYIDSL